MHQLVSKVWLAHVLALMAAAHRLLPPAVRERETSSRRLPKAERSRGCSALAVIAAASMLLTAATAYAQPASSPNFRLTAQTLNTGGGFASSTSFSVFGCLAPEPDAGGASSSTSFRIEAGCAGITGAVALCGNGILDPGEDCDDGNSLDGDGCSATCSIESGWSCSGQPSSCTPICGDGLVLGGEECDDGNTLTGDGCSSTCAIESGYTCSGSPSICTTTCGDGVVAGEEACDDGNLADGDGCSSTCVVEPGYTCTGSPSVCTLLATPTPTITATATPTPTTSPTGTPTSTATSTPTPTAVCGDGVVGAGEQCDLGPDNCPPAQCCSAGCTSNCRVTGQCTGSQGCCVTAADCPAGEGCCGNGAVEPGEECVDGNRLDLDCCSSRCKIEPSGTPGECEDGTTPCTSSTDCGGGLCHQNCELQVCAVFGPHMVSAFVKRTVTVDSDVNGITQRWRSRGDFTLNPGQLIDPDSEEVELIMSQGGTVLYGATVAPNACPPNPSCFVQKGPDNCTKRWKFVDPESDVPGATGWKTGKMSQTRSAVGICENKVSFLVKSGKSATMVTPIGTRFRQTLRIGDDCVTALLTCSAKQESGVNKRLRCSSAEQ